MKSNTPSSKVDGDFAQAIVGYYVDEQGQWVAQLACGHKQHVRHDPPWMIRQWVTTITGRDAMIGYRLYCKKCEEGAPNDDRPNP